MRKERLILWAVGQWNETLTLERLWNKSRQVYSNHTHWSVLSQRQRRVPGTTLSFHFTESACVRMLTVYRTTVATPDSPSSDSTLLLAHDMGFCPFKWRWSCHIRSGRVIRSRNAENTVAQDISATILKHLDSRMGLSSTRVKMVMWHETVQSDTHFRSWSYTTDDN